MRKEKKKGKTPTSCCCFAISPILDILILVQSSLMLKRGITRGLKNSHNSKQDEEKEKEKIDEREISRSEALLWFDTSLKGRKREDVKQRQIQNQRLLRERDRDRETEKKGLERQRYIQISELL